MRGPHRPDSASLFCWHRPTWEEVPEGVGGQVSQPLREDERDDRLGMNWRSLSGGLKFSRSTRPRSETYTGCGRRRDHAQPRSEAPLISSSPISLYGLFRDMRPSTNKQNDGGYGPRRHLLLGPASETKIRVDHLSSPERYRREGECPEGAHRRKAPRDPSTRTSLKDHAMSKIRPSHAVVTRLRVFLFVAGV